MTTRFARFSRLMIFLPYAIPAVIGALMWGFLYSKNFGPLARDLRLLRRRPRPTSCSARTSIFYGLLNVVTWQWAGYYMIILYAALQGIDPTIYEAARIDGANAWQIVLRIKVPLVALGAGADPGVRPHRHPAVLQRAADPAGRSRTARSTPTSRRTCTPTSRRSRSRNFNYGSAISFALGVVVFICVYIFLFATRKRAELPRMTAPLDAPSARHREPSRADRHRAAPAAALRLAHRPRPAGRSTS